MIVGVAGWELEVLGAQSLKAKRSTIRSLKERLRSRFNVSVAETAHHDLWQRAEITVCVVATDRERAESILSRADNLVETDGRARIIDSFRIFY